MRPCLLWRPRDASPPDAVAAAADAALPAHAHVVFDFLGRASFGQAARAWAAWRCVGSLPGRSLLAGPHEELRRAGPRREAARSRGGHGELASRRRGERAVARRAQRHGERAVARRLTSGPSCTCATTTGRPTGGGGHGSGRRSAAAGGGVERGLPLRAGPPAPSLSPLRAAVGAWHGGVRWPGCRRAAPPHLSWRAEAGRGEALFSRALSPRPGRSSPARPPPCSLRPAPARGGKSMKRRRRRDGDGSKRQN